MNKNIPEYSTTVIIDKCEKCNELLKNRIADFKELGVEVEFRRLPYGDYSFYVTLADGKVIDFSRAIVFERKRSAEELIEYKCYNKTEPKTDKVLRKK